MKQQKKRSPVRARDTEVVHFAVCSFFLLMGLTVFIFMVALCFTAKSSGVPRMMGLLNLLLAVPLFVLPAAQLKMHRICRRSYTYCRAAVDRRPDGSARLEFFVEPTQYYMEFPGNGKLGGAGLVGLWYDLRNPRNVFFGNARRETPSPCGWINFAVLLLLCGAADLVFYLVLI